MFSLGTWTGQYTVTESGAHAGTYSGTLTLSLLQSVGGDPDINLTGSYAIDGLPTGPQSGTIAGDRPGDNLTHIRGATELGSPYFYFEGTGSGNTVTGILMTLDGGRGTFTVTLVPGSHVGPV
jgi:hypothetical protein